jgi:hypothetical protein
MTSRTAVVETIAEVQPRPRPRRRALFAILGTAGLLAGAILVLLAVHASLPALLPTATVVQGRQVEVEGRDHVDAGAPIDYRSRPPSSGPHYARTARYGVTERELEPGYWVHTLEHGGIVIVYRCEQSCPDLVGQLRRVYAAAPPSQRFGVVKMSVLPYGDMDHRIAAVAWGWVDEMDQIDAERLVGFYRAHVDRGPEEAL